MTTQQVPFLLTDGVKGCELEHSFLLLSNTKQCSIETVSREKTKKRKKKSKIVNNWWIICFGRLNANYESQQQGKVSFHKVIKCR